MKYAIVEQLRCEARPGLRGTCASCDAEVIAKCGSRRVWHWAHIGVRNCDTWWEPETEWHRAWKNRFPSGWQEIHQFASTGELHIADVKTNAGNVIELQHSSISLLERNSRENFYEPMVWVVDGLRLKRDLPTFREALGNRLPFKALPASWNLPIGNVPIFKRWAEARRPVYIDFGDEPLIALLPESEPILWKLGFVRGGRSVIVTPVSVSSFVADHHGTGKQKGYDHPEARIKELMEQRRRRRAITLTSHARF